MWQTLKLYINTFSYACVMLLRVYIHTGQAYFPPWPGIFFKPARCEYIYTQSNITQASYSPEYITPQAAQSYPVLLIYYVISLYK